MASPGQILRQLLEEHGRTPGWLARELGLRSKQSIYNWIRGVAPRDVSTWPRIAEILGVPLEVLLDRPVEVRTAQSTSRNSIHILRELIALPGPPGQERAVREAVARHLDAIGLAYQIDPKGNLIVGADRPRIVVTAHLDEIAMIVRRVDGDGRLRVGPLGGLYPWKLGEGPVQVLATGGPIDGVLSFGSVHTADPTSNVRQAESGGLNWDQAHVLVGRSAKELERMGVRPGTRVVVHPCRRELLEFSPWVGGYFLDDRADLVAWLLALEALGGPLEGVMFAATSAEEVGGEGALYLLSEFRPEVCIALELGPAVVDAPITLDDRPTVWATDSYATMAAADGDLVADVAGSAGIGIQWQALSSGGSDASCAASHGLCARPFTLGLPMANSHGFEVIHPGSMASLAKLTAALVERIVGGS